MRHPLRLSFLAPLLAALALLAHGPGALAADAAATPAVPAPAASAAPAPADAASAPTAAAAASAPAASLDQRIQDLKADVIQLNRDLLVLEEELLFPASTQVALFVSMDVGRMFALDALQVKLNDQLVASHLYTPKEVSALHRGAVQRVYVGNLRAGSHELVATFVGQGPHERDYKRATSVKFDKGREPRLIELRIRDSMGKLQPEFDVKVWQ